MRGAGLYGRLAAYPLLPVFQLARYGIVPLERCVVGYEGNAVMKGFFAQAAALAVVIFCAYAGLASAAEEAPVVLSVRVAETGGQAGDYTIEDLRR